MKIRVLSIVLIFLFLCPTPTTRSGKPVHVAPAPADTASRTAATVSGTIRHGGTPVSDVEVHVIWEGGSQMVTTGTDGIYGVGGVPTGGWVQIFVRPPIADRLAFRNWQIDPLTADLTKDFNLVDGARLQGEFRRPDDSPYQHGCCSAGCLTTSRGMVW